MRTIKVIIVEHHLILRRAIRRLLQAAGNIEVVDEVSHMTEALESVQRGEDVNLVLMGCWSSAKAGRQVCRQLKQFGAIDVILLPSMNSSEYEKAAAEWGLDGCVCIDELGTKLIPKIQQLYGLDVVH